MIRAYQLGLTIDELEQLSVGMVLDMLIESGNDDYKYKELATQDDFDRF